MTVGWFLDEAADDGYREEEIMAARACPAISDEIPEVIRGR